MDGTAIDGADVTHWRGTDIYKLSMYLPFEVTTTPTIGNGAQTDATDEAGTSDAAAAANDAATTENPTIVANANAASPKTGVPSSELLAGGAFLFLLGAAGTARRLAHMRRS